MLFENLLFREEAHYKEYISPLSSGRISLLKTQFNPKRKGLVEEGGERKKSGKILLQN